MFHRLVLYLIDKGIRYIDRSCLNLTSFSITTLQLCTISLKYITAKTTFIMIIALHRQNRLRQIKERKYTTLNPFGIVIRLQQHKKYEISRMSHRFVSWSDKTCDGHVSFVSFVTIMRADGISKDDFRFANKFVLLSANS